jgi:hypothetical protein
MEIKTVIFDSDDYRVIAKKIYNDLLVFQSVNVHGWVLNRKTRWVDKKGELVWNEVARLDKVHNWTRDGKRRRRRTWVNAIGHDHIDQKVFKYKEVMVDHEPRWTIWRVK